MSLLFLLFWFFFNWAIPFLWILSPIDEFLLLDDLGIFDCISQACSGCCPCWGNSICCQLYGLIMYSLHRWFIELTVSTAIANKQQQKPYTDAHSIDIYFKTSTWKSLVNPWRALSTYVKTRRTEAKIFQTALRSDGKLTNCWFSVSRHST